MTELGFLPDFPLAASPLVLFGLLLIAGAIGGEVVRRVLRLPRIVGYVLIGMLLGPSGFNVLDSNLVSDAWIFVEIALGLVLFDLGRRLHFTWLRNDPWLAATGALESTLTFGFLYFALTVFGVQPIYAAAAAAVGVSTAPAVVPKPSAPMNLMATIFTSQFTPTTPMPLLPTAPIVPATCVPW